MKIVERFYWKCFCGAEHDERTTEEEKSDYPGQATYRRRMVAWENGASSFL